MTTLSIIIAAHNAADYLGRTLQRLAEEIQAAGPGIEVLLVEDASSDTTFEIARTFSQAHPWLTIHQVDFRNVGKVRQFGVEHSHGHHITFLDSDDAFKRGALAWLLAQLQTNPPDAILAPLREVSDAAYSESIDPDLRCQQISIATAIALFLDHRRIQGHLIGKCFARSLFQQCVIPPLTAYEDMAILPGLLLAAQQIVLASDAFYLYLKRPGSLSCRARGMLRLADHIVALEMIERDLCSSVPSYRLGGFWVELANSLIVAPQGLSLLKSHPLVLQRISAIPLLRFLLDRHIRTSLKRKLIKLRSGRISKPNP